MSALNVNVFSYISHISQEFKSADFLKFVEQSDFEEVVKQEHRSILRQPVAGRFIEAQKLRNSPLNRLRYPNCFDHSRVVLPVERNRSDYINGNYVDGYKQLRTFIIMQAPMHHTNYDLWRTVWMNHSRIIVMLCEKTVFNRDTYDMYYYHLEGTLKCGKFEIRTNKIEVQPNYIKTTLDLTDGTGASQEVLHFAFTTWPEKDLPNTAEDFLDFVLAVMRNNEEVKAKLTHEGIHMNTPPIIVHSKMSVDRPGVFCAIQIAISRFNDTGIIALASAVKRIREQRHNAVVNFTHYLFCYRVLAYYVRVIGQYKETPVKPVGSHMMSLFKNFTVPNFFSSFNGQ